MDSTKINWENISNLDDHFITYLLYKEGKSIDAIALIRRINKCEVERHIIKCKMLLVDKEKRNDKLVNLISMDKSERLQYINSLNNDERNIIIDEIYKRYIKFKNTEDRMILIWLIGELKALKLVPFLRMELRSKNVNYRRLACSALGKIRYREAKNWLEDAIFDVNPQVRQYAIKALIHIGDENTIKKLENILNNDKEKRYVKVAALKAIKQIKNRKG